MHRQNSPNNGTATSSERKGAVGYLTHIRAGLPGSHTQERDTPSDPDHRVFLPCPVPEEYQFNQGVCEIHQPILGYAGDP